MTNARWSILDPLFSILCFGLMSGRERIIWRNVVRGRSNEALQFRDPGLAMGVW